MLLTAEASDDLDVFLEELHSELEAEPDKAVTLNKIGAIYSSTGRAGEAVKYLVRATELLPEDASVWNNLGVAHLYLGNALRAIDYFLKATRLESDELVYQFNLSICYEELGRYEEAKKIYLDILEEDETHINSLNNLGNYFAREKNYPKAILYYREVLNIEPENALTWSNLSRVYIWMNNPDETMQCLKKAVEYDPKDYDSWYNLGVGYKLLGLYKNALRCFKVIVDSGKEDNRVNYEIARVVAIMGQDDELALDCLQDAVFADPSNLERAEKHKEFDRLRLTKKYKSLARIGQKKQALFGRPVFVDGCNVAYHQTGKKPRVENIILMREKLLEIGFRQVFFIVSAALKHHIDDKNKFQELEHLAVLQVTPFIADDDYLLIKSAMDQGGVILSNDRFKERLSDKKIADYLKNNQVKFTFVGKDIQLIMGRDFYL